MKVKYVLALVLYLATKTAAQQGVTWEPVEYFQTTTGDSVWAFDSALGMWYDGQWNYGVYLDTLDVVPLSDIPAGMVPVSKAMSFRRGDDGPPLCMALRIDSLPPGYSAEQVRMYRTNTTGVWVPYHELAQAPTEQYVAVPVHMALLDGPFFLALDTIRPSIAVLSDIEAAVAAGTELRDTVRIIDNCAASCVSFLFSRGESMPSLRLIDTTESCSTVITTGIPAGYVHDNAGVRALLVVSDGPHADTLDLSRRVVRAQVSDIVTQPNAWVPLRVTAVPDNPLVASVIDNITGGGYDTNQVRVLRWFDPSSVDGVSRGPHAWVEYAPSRAHLFHLFPGRISWIWTRQTVRPDIGRGITPSLRGDFTITLPPGEWTQFALPWAFDIFLGDIVDATGEEAAGLVIAEYDGPGAPMLIHAPPLVTDAIGQRRTQLSSSHLAYAAYNRLSSAVQLRIPPVTDVMSPIASSSVSQSMDRGWVLDITVETAMGADNRLACGYMPDGAGREVIPAAPTLGLLGACLYERATGTRAQCIVDNALPDGWTTYELLLTNDSTQADTTTVRVDAASVGEPVQASVVDQLSGAAWPAGELLPVAVPAGGERTLLIVVGTDVGVSRAGMLAATRPRIAVRSVGGTIHVAVTAQSLSRPSTLLLRAFDLTGRLVARRSSRVNAGRSVMRWQPPVKGTCIVEARIIDGQRGTSTIATRVLGGE
ncbi:MAG: hypothetical protein GF331_18705 [Chitinivibrionales bacterium]|nr:hypothetical protein [Chitinivibrionales bacterium]